MSSRDALDIDHTGLLSSATLEALQLRKQPFRATKSGAGQDTSGSAGTIQDAELFSDAKTAEQISELKQALITGDNLLLILGEPGSGKSTLLDQLDANSGLRIQCFPVQGSERFSTMNLFAGMLEAFKREVPDTLKQTLDELIPCLQQLIAKNTLSAIVLDNADEVRDSELTQLLSGMLYVNSQDETLLRVALAATPEFENHIPDLLPEGADLPYSSLFVEGLNPARAAAYLGHKLQVAGYEGEFPFSDRDIASLVMHSAGLPSELHALTADVLNEQHGRIEDSLPPELVAGQSTDFLQSRRGKMLLGGLATALILGGLIMFLPGTDSDRSATDATLAGNNPALRPVEVRELRQISNARQTTAESTQTTATQTSETDAPAIPSPPALPRIQPGNNTGDNRDGSSATGATGGNGGNLNPVVQSPDGENGSSAAQTVSSSASSAERQGNTASASNADTSARTESDAPVIATEQNTESAERETANQVATILEPPVSEEDAQLAERLESPNWILLQSPDVFTIQMTASRELESVENFLRQNPLSAPNSIFSFERDGVVWYALAHGVFNSIEAARVAVERMPQSALRDQPWIRSVRRVQSILRTP
ncbi:MAG: SPOR domain-containing protein [Granulosicoccus sp.]